MYFVSVNLEVLEAERRALDYGLSADILIENAAGALYLSVISKIEKRDKVAVICGGGNNGADGLSLARKLFLGGYNVTIYTVCEKFNSFATARLNALKELGARIVPLIEDGIFDPGYYNLIVDAMLGSGLSRDVDGVIKKVMETLNKSNEYVISVDLPSGICADTGVVRGNAVRANETITFCGVRVGHILGEARNYIGNLVVADIGLKPSGRLKAVTAEDIKLPKRKMVSHKYNYGRVRIIAGSPEFIGAAVLVHESALAALKCGAGLSSLCVPNSLATSYSGRIKESTLIYMPDDYGLIKFDAEYLDKIMYKTGAIAIGMGCGDNPELIKIIKYLADNFCGTLILDADAINAIAKYGDISKIFESKKADIILTPHEGEFERIKTKVCDDVQPLFIQAKQLAEKIGGVVVLKGATTIITDGVDIYLNTTGSPCMAKGGSGDVLSGMLAAFACRQSPITAALSACYHFGKCGELAENLYGSESVLASHLIIK